MYANGSLMPDIVVDIFMQTIREQGAKPAFKTAFSDSTTRPIDPERLEEIKDIPCLLIWGNQDNMIPRDYSDGFRKAFNNIAYETIEGAGHAPFVEKTALVYEKLRSFLTR